MKHIKKVVTALTALAMLMPSALPIPVSAENTETVTITPSGGSGIKIIDPATGAEKTADIINKYGSKDRHFRRFKRILRWDVCILI